MLPRSSSAFLFPTCSSGTRRSQGNASPNLSSERPPQARERMNHRPAGRNECQTHAASRLMPHVLTFSSFESFLCQVELLLARALDNSNACNSGGFESGLLLPDYTRTLHPPRNPLPFVNCIQVHCASCGQSPSGGLESGLHLYFLLQFHDDCTKY